VNVPLRPGKRESPHHHPSHRGLLRSAPAFQPGQVDAIIVPTARQSAYLRQAIDLAQFHQCTLLTLCSRRASADQAIRIAKGSGIRIVALNVHELPDLTPRFQTSALLRGSRFARRSDLSLKRNLGLWIAMSAGWNHIMFLDDDISIPQPRDISDAAGMLSTYDAVGLSNDGFPDNSVVCHAFRDAGGKQDTFIGGGALAVGKLMSTSFFPDIYNEDWFFLLNDVALQPAALIGRAVQARYEPYRETMRARSEEFGDILAEGIFSLLDRGLTLTDATPSFWRQFLLTRRKFIDEIVVMVENIPIEAPEKRRMTAALKGAKGRNLLVDPQLCTNYIRAWRADRKLWRQHVEPIEPMDLEKLLAELGLMDTYRPSV
jgi:hypothetical protein